MELNAEQKRVAVSVINCFETGGVKSNYANVDIFHDGPGDCLQVTYGFGLTQYGNLGECIALYAAAGGRFSDDFRPYVGKIQSSGLALVHDDHFLGLLKDAGHNDPLMVAVQDKMFDKRYYLPALAWATAEGFTLPLSALVVLDSYVHSGSILTCIRKKFAEVPPAAGGEEKAWVKAYVEARQSWLANHSRVVLHGTVYRTHTLLAAINTGNWGLTADLSANGIRVTGAKPVQP
jgi:chitosanase